MDIWVPVEGWPYYEITPYGRIRSIDRILTNRLGHKKFYKGQILKPQLTPMGYLSVQLADDFDKIDKQVHRLVCATFHGPQFEDMICRHLDDNPLNNYYENLMWGTQKDNVLDSIRNGRIFTGSSLGFPPMDPVVLSESAERRWSDPEQRAA